MAIGPVNELHYVAGDSILLEFAVTDQDDAVAVITGDTPRFAVRRQSTQTPVISTDESPATATATITNGAGGIFEVAVAAADTVGLSGVYIWDAELTDATGGVQTVARGTMAFHTDLI